MGWLHEGSSPTYPSAMTLHRTFMHPEDTDILTPTVQADLGKEGSTSNIYVHLHTHTGICVLKNRGEWIKKVWYTHIMEYYSAMKKNEMMPLAAARIHLEIVIRTEVRQRKTDTCDITYMWKLKRKGTNEVTCQTEIRVTNIENKLWLPVGEGWGSNSWEIGIDITHYHI